MIGFDDTVPTAAGLATVHRPHRVKGEQAGHARPALLGGAEPGPAIRAGAGG